MNRLTYGPGCVKAPTIWAGIRGNAFELIKSYLSDRVQYVQINNLISSNKKILCGVPPGSVLGPLLFLLYVNDNQNASHFIIRLFADDTLLYFSKKTMRSRKTC